MQDFGGKWNGVSRNEEKINGTLYLLQKYKIFRLFDAALVRQDCFFGPGACSLKSLKKGLIYHRFLIDWGVTFFLLIFWLLLRGSV